jgi:hypothetical protein
MSDARRRLGQFGERAAAHLESKGYRILRAIIVAGWEVRHNRTGRRLSRSSKCARARGDAMGTAVESLTLLARAHQRHRREAYCEANLMRRGAPIDVTAVDLTPAAALRLEHIENAFQRGRRWSYRVAEMFKRSFRPRLP